MDSDLHAEHAEHAQQAQHAQHAQQAQQAQHDYDYDAEFEDVSSEAGDVPFADEEKPLTKLQQATARAKAQRAATKRARKLQQALARAGRAAQRDELEHPTKRHSQKRASRADALAKEDAATILDILISIIRHVVVLWLQPYQSNRTGTTPARPGKPSRCESQ